MRKSCVIGSLLFLATFASAAFDPAAFNAAVGLYNQHKLLEAQQAFEVLATATPDNSDIQFYLGRLALQRNDYQEATIHLEKAVALSPNDGRLHLRLGDAYGLAAQKAGFFSQIGWARKCQAEYTKAVELDPKNIDARWSLMEYCRQAPSIVGGGIDKALLQAQEIKKLDPPRGRQALAQVYLADNKYDLALAQFDEVLKDSPDDYTSLYQVGRLAASSGQYLDRGLASLRRCLELAPAEGEPGRAPTHWRIGNILERQGDKAGARAEYQASLKEDPKFSFAADSLKKL